MKNESDIFSLFAEDDTNNVRVGYFLVTYRIYALYILDAVYGSGDILRTDCPVVVFLIAYTNCALRGPWIRILAVSQIAFFFRNEIRKLFDERNWKIALFCVAEIQFSR